MILLKPWKAKFNESYEKIISNLQNKNVIKVISKWMSWEILWYCQITVNTSKWKH